MFTGFLRNIKAVQPSLRLPQLVPLHRLGSLIQLIVLLREAFKVVGAEVLSDEQARRCNGTFVSAPAAKRLPMICLALAAARLPCISKSLAARIAGNWVSIFMCRHPLCCILNGIFAFGSKSLADTDDVVPLPRRVAEELALAFHYQRSFHPS